MAASLAPRELGLLKELKRARARGERPTPFSLGSLLGVSVEELEALLERLFELGLVEWEVSIPGATGPWGRLASTAGRSRWSPRITRRGLDLVRAPRPGRPRRRGGVRT